MNTSSELLRVRAKRPCSTLLHSPLLALALRLLRLRSVASGLMLGAMRMVSAEEQEPAIIPVEPGQSIQAAINAAPNAAVIRLGAGEWKEHLVVSKPLTLEGAGWEKTRLTIEEPPADEVAKVYPELNAKRKAAASPEEKRNADSEWIERVTRPAIWIRDAQQVTLRKLRVQGVSDRGRQDGGTESTLVCFQRARGSVDECAVVGPFGNGIRIMDGSEVEARRSLVAAIWGLGIAVRGRGGDGADIPSRLQLANSEVRNVYHYGIAIGAGCDSTTIERCRISGTAWHGIRYDDASPTITGNTIFAHARSGIYASGTTKATVRGNLFWRNEMSGVSCWLANTDLIEGNTFAGNLREGLDVLGASKPTVKRNVFFGNPVAIDCGTTADRDGKITAAGEPVLGENVFWQNKVILRRTDETLPTPAGSMETDPQFRDATKQDFTLAPTSPARGAGAGASDPLSTASPWPLLAEEQAIIPSEGAYEFSFWTAPGAAKPSKKAADLQLKKRRDALSTVQISATGVLKWKGEELSLEALGAELEARAKWITDDPVIVQAEKDADYRSLLKVLDLCREANIQNVQIGANVPPPDPAKAEEERIARMVEKNRQAARLRAAQDQQNYTPEQLREIESLYQVANTKGLGAEEARASLKQLLEKYDKANRTGCATLYLGQSSEGAERIEYLTRAIEKFSDCYYFNGCQVGGYGRYVLALTLWQKGEKEKARALIKDLKTTLKDATDHGGRPITELAAEADKQFATTP